MLASTLEKIRARKATQKKLKKKPPKWLYPISIEREYQRDLLSLTKYLKSLFNSYLLPEIPSMINEVNRKIPNDRLDDFLDRLNAIVLFIKRAVTTKTKSTISKADDVSLQVSSFNRTQFQKMNQSVFGIDLFLNEPWLEDQLKLFANQNAQLITNLSDQEIDRVSGIVERGLQEGKTYSDVAKELKKSYAISDRRAKLIARDQTKKLNSSLTKLRQQEIGVEEYIWQTSGDEMVRPTHAANDGKKFRWDKPPKTGHPGDEVNCRCTAIAVLDKILDLE
jgi:SPP1 gp7 family putative phage head morphogenesis protein